MDHLLTEAQNPASTRLDELSPLEIVLMMNDEDHKVAPAVRGQADAIARAIEIIADRLRSGGRLIYAGAGTSGRLGVLDATECPPTFNSRPEQVVGIIAGGPRALTQAVEGAEDHPEFAERDLDAIGLSKKDVLVGIATSGRTPYVLGAVAFARSRGAFSIGVSCSPDSELGNDADLAITVPVGPEVLSGSTRLKAGTATKLVLNMLTTGAMVRLGKTFGNLMVDLRATNEKLKARTNRILRRLTGLSAEEAADLLQRCGGELKTALIAQLGQVGPNEARRRLGQANGHIKTALAAVGHPRATAPHTDLLLGIDGGGSHTVALLARIEMKAFQIIGKGEAGPSNLHAVGFDPAMAAVDRAIQSAFEAAGIARGPAGAACLGFAGAGRAEEQERIRGWAKRNALAERIEVTSDVALLLAAGTPEGWGVAVVAGTGSIAFAKTRVGAMARAGGWGYLLGDEGSGYAIALAGLRAVARSADLQSPPRLLARILLEQLAISQPQELIAKVYGETMDRAAIANLAPLVTQAARDGDAVASSIIDEEAKALAITAAAAAGRVFGAESTLPLALAGGLLAGNEAYRGLFLEHLKRLGIVGKPTSVVVEPALGAIRLAMEAASV